jgi:uncharacterized protein (DUF1330 family)
MSAFWIASIDVTNPESYGEYAKRAGPAIAKFDGVFKVRGGEVHVLEGKPRDRNVVIEFPSVQAAKDCYASPDYQEAIQYANNASVRDLFIIQGYDG